MLRIQLASANAFKLVNEGREVAGYAWGKGNTWPTREGFPSFQGLFALFMIEE